MIIKLGAMLTPRGHVPLVSHAHGHASVAMPPYRSNPRIHLRPSTSPAGLPAQSFYGVCHTQREFASSGMQQIAAPADGISGRKIPSPTVRVGERPRSGAPGPEWDVRCTLHTSCVMHDVRAPDGAWALSQA